MAFFISVINIIQFHFRQNIIRFFLRRKEIKKTLNPSRMYDIIFWSVFLSSLYFKHSFANEPFLEYLDSLAKFTFFSMSSPVDGSRHDRIILVAGFLRYIYGLSLDMYVRKIYFFNFVFIVFLIVIFFPKNWQQIWWNLSIFLVWNPSAIAYNTN